jgi:SAM-dependent methyltransferase
LVDNHPILKESSNLDKKILCVIHNSSNQAPKMIESLIRRLLFSLKYLGNPPWDTGESPPELLAFINTHPPGNALDLGCGTGTNLITLAKAGWQVTGVDFVPLAIRQARSRFNRLGLEGELIIGDVTDIPRLRDRRFDLILDMGCYHGLVNDRREKYRQNLADWLLLSGSFLLYGFISVESGSRGISSDDEEKFERVMRLDSKSVSSDPSGHPSAWWHYERFGELK